MSSRRSSHIPVCCICLSGGDSSVYWRYQNTRLSWRRWEITPKRRIIKEIKHRNTTLTHLLTMIS